MSTASTTARRSCALKPKRRYTSRWRLPSYSPMLTASASSLWIDSRAGPMRVRMDLDSGSSTPSNSASPMDESPLLGSSSPEDLSKAPSICSPSTASASLRSAAL